MLFLSESFSRSVRIIEVGDCSVPSWNIHIAHAEDVLARGGGLAAAVRDRNAFLFGNVLPDIRVGYMVPGIVEPIPYRITHFAKPEHIPKPREWEFWDTYVAPALTGEAPCGATGCELFTLQQELDRINRVHYPQRYANAAAVVDPSRGSVAGAAVAAGSPVAVDSAGTAGASAPASTGASSSAGANSAAGVMEADSCAPAPARLSCRGAALNHPGGAKTPAANEALSGADVAQSVRDMVLGTWLHLLADNIWNVRVNEYLDSIGGKPSEGFRIKKQGDFNWFGKTLSISSIVCATDRLAAAAGRFPQYPISRDEALYTAAVVHETVRENPGNPEHPPYRLLNDDFFANTFIEVAERAERLFVERAQF